MRSLRSRGVRRYGATRPPRGVRAEVLVRSTLGSWALQPAVTPGGDRRVSNSRPSGTRPTDRSTRPTEERSAAGDRDAERRSP